MIRAYHCQGMCRSGHAVVQICESDEMCKPRHETDNACDS